MYLFMLEEVSYLNFLRTYVLSPKWEMYVKEKAEGEWAPEDGEE